jgi:hypothetical protein
MAFFNELLETESTLSLVIICLFAFVFWFLPAFLAFFLNRKYFKIIALASIPAGLSFIAWIGLLGWSLSNHIKLPKKVQAATNKMMSKLEKPDNTPT